MISVIGGGKSWGQLMLSQIGQPGYISAQINTRIKQGSRGAKTQHDRELLRDSNTKWQRTKGRGKGRSWEGPLAYIYIYI